MENEYYCTKCEKTHSINYKPHKKYASAVIVDAEEDFEEELALWDDVPTEEFDPTIYTEDHNKDIEDFKNIMIEEIEKIKKLIDLWSWEIS